MRQLSISRFEGLLFLALGLLYYIMPPHFISTTTVPSAETVRTLQSDKVTGGGLGTSSVSAP